MKNNKEVKVSETIDKHTPQSIAHYPKDLINFLGEREQIKKINVYGHRIIYVMLEMLKSKQVHKISDAELLDIVNDELVMYGDRLVSITQLREEEREKRRMLESGKKLAIIEENYFADNFTMLQMIITTKALNDNGRIKVPDNSVFHEQLKLFKTLGTHKVRSNNGKETMISSFIEQPIYDKGQNYIRFYISRTTANLLLNNIDGYTKVIRNIVFKNQSEKPINLYLFLKKKFGKINGGIISINNFVEELSLPSYCLKKSKLAAFLTTQQKNLNQTNSLSFGFKIEDEKIVFALYETPALIGIELADNAEYQAKNAIQNIKKKRNLDDKQMVYIKAKFKEHGYQKMREITKQRINPQIKGNEYLKLFVQKCVELGY